MKVNELDKIKMSSMYGIKGRVIMDDVFVDCKYINPEDDKVTPMVKIEPVVKKDLMNHNSYKYLLNLTIFEDWDRDWTVPIMIFDTEEEINNAMIEYGKRPIIEAGIRYELSAIKVPSHHMGDFLNDMNTLVKYNIDSFKSLGCRS